jgi:TonB family protein
VKTLLIASLLTVSACAQSKYVDVGTLKDRVYQNECIGITFQLPAGWVFGSSMQAQALRPDARTLLLIDAHPNPSNFSGIGISTVDAPAAAISTQQYVTRSAQQYIKDDAPRRTVLREPYQFEVAGRTFLRADLHSPFYHAMLATYHRGYFLEIWASGDTAEHLTDAVAALSGLSFDVDQRDPQCTLDPNPRKALIGIISSKPVGEIKPNTLIRVSQAVSNGMLLEKPAPVYPPDARAQHLEGNVVLKARISTEGTVEDVSLVSGDPLLAPAALEAVRHWKYKPYLLNGVPVRVETQVTVAFVLHPE